jgi:hypothetical protein
MLECDVGSGGHNLCRDVTMRFSPLLSMMQNWTYHKSSGEHLGACVGAVGDLQRLAPQVGNKSESNLIN